MSYPPEIKRALRMIIIGQCTGLIGPLLFGNGFMLAYVLRLGVPSYRILFLFALMPLIGMVFTLPFSYLADRTSKRKIGAIGLAVSIAGFFLLPLAAFTPSTAIWWLTASCLIFSIGNTANSASWFALLSPIVPAEIRGRWFGQMRTSWQATSIVFALSVAALFRHFSDLYIFQLVLLLAGILMIFRLVIFMQIPELDPPHSQKNGFLKSMNAVLRFPGYLRFCIYIFLQTLICAGSGLLGLLEKKALGFSDSQVVVMGNLTGIGTIAGFYMGGKMVDRVGARSVFLTGHILFSLALAGVLLRGFMPLPAIVTLGIFSFLIGVVLGSTGIASSSELLALIPPENKSLSTGFNLTLASAGMSLTGLVNGQVLKEKIFPEQWMFVGHTLSNYDILIAGFMVMSILMSATMGLVPPIRNLRNQWFPQNN
jgi:MFS family permease